MIRFLIRDIRLSALRENPIAYGTSEADDEWKMHCQDAENRNGKWFVVAVSKEGKLIGMLGAVEIFGTYMQHQVEIIQAYVDPKFRRLKVLTRTIESAKLSVTLINV